MVSCLVCVLLFVLLIVSLAPVCFVLVVWVGVWACAFGFCFLGVGWLTLLGVACCSDA